MIKRFLSLSVLIAILWGCCSVEDTPRTAEKPDSPEQIYTVTYKSDYGTVPSEITGLKKGDKLTAEQLPVLTTDGYTFTGWYNGENEITTEYKIIGDLELTAQWTANGYAIAYELNGGTNGESNPKNYNVESETITLSAATKTGYTFGGWYKDEKFSGEKITKIAKGSIIGDITLYAKWNVNTYTVKFNANGGNGEMTDMSFNYNEEKALTANTFTREDYTFAGWATTTDGTATYADMAKVKNLIATANGEVILYAVWNENDKVLPVIFSQPTAVDYGDSITLSCDTDGAKISYTIDNVTTDYTNAIVITKDVNITAFATKDGMKDSDTTTASYTVKTYTVTYKSDYDTAPSDVAGLKKGDTLTAEQLPELTRTGYTFAGWYNGETKVDAGHVVISNLELTAQWDVNTYIITYELNGGTNVTSNPASYTVETETITLADATKSGYTFEGWYNVETFTEESKITKIEKGSTGVQTLYAKWIATETFIYVQGATITNSISGSSIFNGSEVIVSNFEISDHEVTQAEYEKYCGYGGSKPSNSNGVGINYPAYYVSWFDALVYCNKRSIKEGLTPCYKIKSSTDPTDWGDVPTSSDSTWNAVECNWKANGYRLPTEAEWEYAARGGNGLAGYQYEYAGSDTIDDVAWYYSNSGGKTHAVKGKEANGLGLYDMSGNVWEWCWDGSASGDCYRRGGSWNHSADCCAVSYRNYYYAYYRYNCYGFRVVRSAK